MRRIPGSGPFEAERQGRERGDGRQAAHLLAVRERLKFTLDLPLLHPEALHDTGVVSYDNALLAGGPGGRQDLTPTFPGTRHGKTGRGRGRTGRGGRLQRGSRCGMASQNTSEKSGAATAARPRGAARGSPQSKRRCRSRPRNGTSESGPVTSSPPRKNQPPSGAFSPPCEVRHSSSPSSCSAQLSILFAAGRPEIELTPLRDERGEGGPAPQGAPGSRRGPDTPARDVLSIGNWQGASAGYI